MINVRLSLFIMRILTQMTTKCNFYICLVLVLCYNKPYREMKKAHIAFIATLLAVTTNVAMGAVAVKKAAPVATQSASTSSTTASLVPNVLSLVSNVQQLSVKQKAMAQECVPSSTEISFVDEIVKEWAKTGAMTAEEVASKLKRKPCSSVRGYASDLRASVTTGGDVCFATFNSKSDEGTVWYGFPKVSIVNDFCEDGTTNCKNKQPVSDIYQIFDLVDFSYEDYTKKEATMAAKLIAKIDNCSDSKLSEKKRAMWGEFLTTTIGGVGQKTNTATIMDVVGEISKSDTNVSSGLSSLGAFTTQFLNK